MKDRSLDDLKTAFLAGELTEEETHQLKQELSRQGADEMHIYFSSLENRRDEHFSRITESEFRKSVDARSVRKWMLAASISLVGLISLTWYLGIERPKEIARSEVDRSMEITLKALTSITQQYEKGIYSVSAATEMSEASLSPLKQFEIKN